MIHPSVIFLGLVIAAALPPAVADDISWNAPHAANPIVPGYFADASFLQADGKLYIYATLDPWGAETLGCWESVDGKNWTYRKLNWPTKTLCTGPTSMSAMVWAASVVKATDNKYHMFVSVGSEVWTGVAEHPLGPWKNALGDKPLIPSTWNKEFHMIDAEAFIDRDGRTYLYWGSGWNWKNGHCFVVPLNDNLTAFAASAKDVTTPHYFEGPFMVRDNDHYFLTYSNGNTTADSYKIYYAIGSSALGPFNEPENPLLLTTDRAKNILSPGHHAVLSKNGHRYIIYHRHSIPYNPDEVHRQLCIDDLIISKEGLLSAVQPTHKGVDWTQGRLTSSPAYSNVAFTSSSQRSETNGPARVSDDNYATLWKPEVKPGPHWIMADLQRKRLIGSQQLRPEYPWKPYTFKVETSDDGTTWKTLVDYTERPATGSPIDIPTKQSCRYVRLMFTRATDAASIGLFEWLFLESQ